MKQIQVQVPSEGEKNAVEVLKEYSSDIVQQSATSGEQEITLVTATVNAQDIDEITAQLKAVKEFEPGQLKIRLLDQESLIEKGQKTKGSATRLSQEEVYSKAQESALLTRPQWILMGLSAAIASYGLMLDNIIVVIGAMMLAPVLSPLVSSSIALTVGDETMLNQGLLTAVTGGLMAIAVSALVVIPFQPELNSTLLLITSAGLPNLLLSLFVGAAAALAFVTDYRDQIAGVAVAVALVPPLAATGIGLRIDDLIFARSAFSIASVNFLAVLVSGSLALKLLGFAPSTYYKKKTAERLNYVLPLAVVVMIGVAYMILAGP